MEERAFFCSEVAGKLTITWGNLVMLLVNSPRVLDSSLRILVIMREVSIPSPVGSPGRMMWPDCSPPSLICFLSMADLTLASPTAVTSTLMPFFLVQLSKPWLTITVVAMVLSLRYSAKMARIKSPSISSPISLISIQRSPSPS